MKTGSLSFVRLLSKTVGSNKEVTAKYLPKKASVLASLFHPHILHTYRIMETTITVQYVLELAENGDILDYLEALGNIAELEAHFVFRQILGGWLLA